MRHSIYRIFHSINNSWKCKCNTPRSLLSLYEDACITPCFYNDCFESWVEHLNTIVPITSHISRRFALCSFMQPLVCVGIPEHLPSFLQPFRPPSYNQPIHNNISTRSRTITATTSSFTPGHPLSFPLSLVLDIRCLNFCLSFPRHLIRLILLSSAHVSNIAAPYESNSMDDFCWGIQLWTPH